MMNAKLPSSRVICVALVMGWSLASVACQSSRPVSQTTAATPAPAPARSTAPGAAKPLPADSIPAIAQREVIRRQEQIRRMDDAALRASQAMAEDDLDGAVKGYRSAIDGL